MAVTDTLKTDMGAPLVKAKPKAAPSIPPLSSVKMPTADAYDAAQQAVSDANVAIAKGKAAKTAALPGVQAELRSQEKAELEPIEKQLTFKPDMSYMRDISNVFMLVGMLGSFLGTKGGVSASANAQAALTGMMQGLVKGSDAEFLRQKSMFDENYKYLSKQVDDIREKYKDYQKVAVEQGIAPATSKILEDFNALGKGVDSQLIEKIGADAALDKVKHRDEVQKNTNELIIKLNKAQDEHKKTVVEVTKLNSEIDKLKAEAKNRVFTPEMGQLQAALAEKGVSLPTGLRSAQQQISLYRGLLDRNPGKTADQIADMVKSGKINIAAAVKEAQTAAGIVGKVLVAENDMAPMGQKIKEIANDLPRGEFMPINRLLATAENQLSSTGQRILKLRINAMLNAYDVLSARGGTDKAKRAETRGLLTSADSPDVLNAAVDNMIMEAKIAEQAGSAAIESIAGGSAAASSAPRHKVGDKIEQDGNIYTVRRVDNAGNILEAN